MFISQQDYIIEGRAQSTHFYHYGSIVEDHRQRLQVLLGICDISRHLFQYAHLVDLAQCDPGQSRTSFQCYFLELS